jgi:hypothetical protein
VEYVSSTSMFVARKGIADYISAGLTRIQPEKDKTVRLYKGASPSNLAKVGTSVIISRDI